MSLLDVEEIKNHFEIRTKNNIKRRHFYISWFVSFMNIFIKDYKKKFEENYVTIVGDVIYVPEQLYEPLITLAPDSFLRYSKFNQGHMYLRAMLRHEYVHLLQREREPWLFGLKYFLSPKSRFKYEVEAYWISMLWRQLAGEVDIDFKQNMVSMFTDGLYLFDLGVRDKAMFRARCVNLVNDFMYKSVNQHISDKAFLDHKTPPKNSPDYVRNVVSRLGNEMPIRLSKELNRIADNIYG